jgi:hypothetical protein
MGRERWQVRGDTSTEHGGQKELVADPSQGV